MAARIDIPSVYDEVRKAYAGMGYPVSGDRLVLSEKPTYTNGNPVPADVMRPEVSGGNTQDDGTVRINPNYRSVMKHWGLKGSGRDFLRLIIGHELGHHVDRTLLRTKARSAERRRLLQEIARTGFHTGYTDSYGPDTDPRKLDKELLAEYLAKQVSGRLGKSASCGLCKSAASKLRAMLNAGKLTAEQISKLRSSGMLPSRARYVEGARAMLKRRLEKIFAHAVGRDIDISIRTGVPRGDSQHYYRYFTGDPVTRKVTVAGGGKAHISALDVPNPEKAKHFLELPGLIGHNAGGVRGKFDTSRVGLHDLVTANHELDEYMGFWRSGGPTHWRHPSVPLAYVQTHQPGVLRRERRLYELLCRQLGIRNPDWRRFKSGGTRSGTVPSRRSDAQAELALSAFTPRDETAALRVIRDVPLTDAERKVVSGGISGDFFDSVWDAARGFSGRAADLAKKRGLSRVERYFRSNPVAYHRADGEQLIVTPNYERLRQTYMKGAPEFVRPDVAGGMWKYYNGR